MEENKKVSNKTAKFRAEFAKEWMEVQRILKGSSYDLSKIVIAPQLLARK